MMLLFITLIRAVPMSQLNPAAHCRSPAAGDTVPQEPDAQTYCDGSGGGDAVSGVTSVSPLCPHPCKEGRELASVQGRRQ